MSKVTTFLMYPHDAKQAVEFYQSVFEDQLKVTGSLDNPAGPGFMTSFEIDGQHFNVFEGGPHFKFTEAISLFISCRDQSEVDYFWNQLSSGGGKEKDCGWVEDKFGVSWQIVPQAMMEMLASPDHVAAGRATQAMLKMRKLVIEDLEAAFKGQ